MPVSFWSVVYGLVLPAAIAAIVAAAGRRWLPEGWPRRLVVALGLATGFVVGYRLLELGPWLPRLNRHWLPYLVLLAAAAGPTFGAGRAATLKRVLSYLPVLALAAWLLVPNRENLARPRLVYVLAWPICVLLLTALFSPLAERLKGPLLPVVLTSTFVAAAVVLFLAGSILFAEIAGAAAGAMAGLSAAAALNKKTNWLEGVELPLFVLLAGALLVCQVGTDSDVPLASYLLVAMAPLMLWVSVQDRWATLSRTKRLALHAALPAFPLALAIALAVLASVL